MIRMRAMAAVVGMFCCMMAALAGPAQAMQFHRVLLADNNVGNQRRRRDRGWRCRTPDELDP